MLAGRSVWGCTFKPQRLDARVAVLARAKHAVDSAAAGSGCRNRPRFVAVALAVAGGCSRSVDSVPPKALDQPVETKKPGMALVREWIGGAKNAVEILNADLSAGRRTLLALQVTRRSRWRRSPLETGGVSKRE